MMFWYPTSQKKIVQTIMAGMAFASFGVSTSNAVVRRHDVSDKKYQEFAQNFPAPVHFKLSKKNPDAISGMGVLIAPNWILTAGHIAKSVKPGAMAYGPNAIEVEAAFAHPKWLQAHDLGLVKLKQPISAIKIAPLYRETDENLDVVAFVGRGDYGDGKRGVKGSDRKVRAAQNFIVAVDERKLIAVFDAPGAALPLEGAGGPGDSGGPVFMEREGIYYLVGVSSGSNEGGKDAMGVYGNVEYFARVSTHLDWIKEIMGDEFPAN